MAVFVIAGWVLFVGAFAVVKTVYPNVGKGKRKLKQIKNQAKYDDDGFDENGFSALGFHRNGTKYDENGFDRFGNRKPDGLDDLPAFDPIPKQEATDVNEDSDGFGEENTDGESDETFSTPLFSHMDDDAPNNVMPTPEENRKPPRDLGKSLITIFAAFTAVILVAATLIYLNNSTCVFGHKVIEATCDRASFCLKCNKSIGKPLGHDYEKATCEEYETCKRCRATRGEPLGHTTDNGICTRCNRKITDGRAAENKQSDESKKSRNTVSRSFTKSTVSTAKQ